MGNTYFYVIHNESGGCEDPVDYYAWYPTASLSPQTCYTSSSCECEPTGGMAFLERDTTRAQLLVTKNAAVTTHAVNSGHSAKLILASANFQPPPTPHLQAPVAHGTDLANLRKQRPTQGKPEGGKPVNWHPHPGIMTNETKWIWVHPQVGADIPVKIQFGHMDFSRANDPKNLNHIQKFRLGVEVDQIPGNETVIGTLNPAIDPDNPYRGMVRLPDRREVIVLTSRPLR
jgi:hypothetical protein